MRALRPALGGADLHGAAAALGEDLRQDAELGALGDRGRDDDQRRDAQRARVVLQQELLRGAGDVVAGLVDEVEGLAVGEHAVADLEDLRVGLRPVDGDRDRVHRAGRPVA